MAAALSRRATGLCVRCVHRELCRLVWRPQTAVFSSKTSDRKQPRRTHIKKAKPQPAVDVAKVLEQLFSQRRPGTLPPVGKARPAKASSLPTKPPSTSSEPAASVFPATSSFKQTFESLQASASPSNPKTSSERPHQSPLELNQVFAAGRVSSVTVPPTSTTSASLASEAAVTECQTSAETIETKAESSSGNDAVEGGANKPEQMTLESVTLHVVQALVESLKADELLQTKSVLDGKAEKQLQELLVQTGTGAEHKAAAETESSGEDEGEIFTQVLSKWNSLSEDLQELEGESDMLVNELLCHVPAALYKTPDTVKTCPASDPPAAAKTDSWQMEQTGTNAEAVVQESITLADVMAAAGGTETEGLETRNAAEKEAEALTKEEKVDGKTEDAAVFEDTDETSIILEAMFSSRQGLREPTDTILVGQETEKESREQEGGILEAMNFESVTLAEVEASLGTLESESLSEATDYLKTRAEIRAGEKRTEVEDGVAPEEPPEALKMAFLSLPEGGAPSDAPLTDPVTEELLFSVPWHVTEGQIGQEVVRTIPLDASVATEAVDGDCLASAALKEVLLRQEVEQERAQTEASGNEDGTGTRTDLDPVKKLFLEKIREYDNMRRLNGGLLEAEPDCEKYLSEEATKLRRHYGGGDLSSFPQFTFTEPKMDP